jgi:hypothetical protein
MTPNDIAAGCVMGSTKSRFVHGTLRLIFQSPQNAKGSEYDPPGMDLPKPDGPD